MSDDDATRATPRQRAWRGHWVYLIYLSNLGWQPWFDPTAGWREWLVVAAVVVQFVPLWGMTRTTDPHRLRRVVGTIVVIGIIGTVLNVGASVLFVFAAAAVAPLGEDEALRWHVGLTLAIVLLMAFSPIALPYRIYGVLPSLIFVWVVGLGTRTEAATVAEAERLRIENVRIEALATAAERERIARDLHDLLGQSLTGLVVRAQLVGRLAAVDPAAAAIEASSLEEGARVALEQVRAAVSGLNDVSLDDEVATARDVLAAAGVDARVVVATQRRPSPLVERSLALALREAVTNVVRHAHAASCTIEIVESGETWSLEVHDDGRGGDHTEGAGLRGMRERIAAVGGRVERWSDRGTSLRVTVPA